MNSPLSKSFWLPLVLCCVLLHSVGFADPEPCKRMLPRFAVRGAAVVLGVALAVGGGINAHLEKQNQDRHYSDARDILSGSSSIRNYSSASFLIDAQLVAVKLRLDTDMARDQLEELQHFLLLTAERNPEVAQKIRDYGIPVHDREAFQAYIGSRGGRMGAPELPFLGPVQAFRNRRVDDVVATALAYQRIVLGAAEVQWSGLVRTSMNEAASHHGDAVLNAMFDQPLPEMGTAERYDFHRAWTNSWGKDLYEAAVKDKVLAAKLYERVKGKFSQADPVHIKPESYPQDADEFYAWLKKDWKYTNSRSTPRMQARAFLYYVLELEMQNTTKPGERTVGDVIQTAIGLDLLQN